LLHTLQAHSAFARQVRTPLKNFADNSGHIAKQYTVCSGFKKRTDKACSTCNEDTHGEFFFTSLRDHERNAACNYKIFLGLDRIDG